MILGSLWLAAHAALAVDGGMVIPLMESDGQFPSVQLIVLEGLRDHTELCLPGHSWIKVSGSKNLPLIHQNNNKN